MGKLILTKIIKIAATRCHILKPKCTKFDFDWGSLQRSPIPLAGFKGPTSKWKGGEKKGWEGKGWVGEGKRWAGGRGRKGRGSRKAQEEREGREGGNKGKPKGAYIVLSELHLRITGRHLSMGSHSVICQR